MNKEISAEMLLGYMYPEMQNKWSVKCMGTFYRNYSSDALSVNPAAGEVELSRDGFLGLLPQGMISDNEELRTAKDPVAAHNEMSWRNRLLLEALSPIDTFAFRYRMAIEKEVSEILHDKIKILLKEYFGQDLDAEKDPFVRKIMAWLPHITRYRGDLPFVKMLLEAITGYKVEMDLSHRFSESESPRAWLPEARYSIIIPGLTAEEFKSRIEELDPLREFIREWIIPYDVAFELDIRSHPSGEKAGFNDILNYNSDIQ